jgi:hypothetical protein
MDHSNQKGKEESGYTAASAASGAVLARDNHGICSAEMQFEIFSLRR